MSGMLSTQAKAGVLGPEEPKLQGILDKRLTLHPPEDAH